MAKRDPNKTARNKVIEAMKKELREMLPEVLAKVGLPDEAVLNAKIGSKHDSFFDLRNDVISGPDEFLARWAEALKNAAEVKRQASSIWLYENIRKHKVFGEYARIFIKRSYLKHFDELSKVRPELGASIAWIGQTNANYGLLVAPRFRNGQWENDKSEIRSFDKLYWTIGHVMKTGLVVPGKEDGIHKFSDINQYLLFFRDVLVRQSGSKYQCDIAEHYVEYVRNSSNPESIPLLIPEFRYDGLAKKHIYRLDFVIVNPFTQSRFGFELSPWSTHGYLAKIHGLTQAEINEIASDNFEREMKRHRAFFNKHGIFCLIYTDEALKNTRKIFDEEIKPHLEVEAKHGQFPFAAIKELFGE